MPVRMGQKVCSPACAITHARGVRVRAQKKADRVKRESLKTLSDHRKAAQAAFNQYVRERDRHKGCISCGTMTAGQYHAGHYRTRAAAPQLAFNTYNVNKQCAQCNNYKSGNVTDYRAALVIRYGERIVERLECDQESPKVTREYLTRLRGIFSRRARHIAKIRNAIKQRHF